MSSIDPTPSLGHPTFKAFQDLLASEAPSAIVIQEILTHLQTEGLAETALALFKRHRVRSNALRAPEWEGLRLGLEAAAGKARTLRLHQWQLDPGRRTFRFSFSVRHPLCELNPSALLHTLVEVFLEAGLPIAMGLEKSPRPMVTLGPPLPIGSEGLNEWVDCVLREPSAVPASQWPARLKQHCPPGLDFIDAHIVPNHSSPLLELATQARWRWECPEDLRDTAKPRLEAFYHARSFEIEKTGKVDGRKGVKRIEVRAFVTFMKWDGDTLFFSTRIQPGETPSPLKLLSGILGLEPTQIKHLSRLEILLAEDTRLEENNKYEPKLHNIYEDAVLLESDNPVRFTRDDDDDGLLLNR